MQCLLSPSSRAASTILQTSFLGEKSENTRVVGGPSLMQADLLALALHRGPKTLYPLPTSTPQNQNSEATNGTRWTKALTEGMAGWKHLTVQGGCHSAPKTAAGSLAMSLKRLLGGAWVNRAAPQRSTRSARGHSRSVSQRLSESSVSSQSPKMASKFAQMVLNPRLDNGRLGF